MFHNLDKLKTHWKKTFAGFGLSLTVAMRTEAKARQIFTEQWIHILHEK